MKELQYKIPKEVKMGIENISEEEFWKAEGLEGRFKEDDNFGSIMWAGFLGLIEEKSNEINVEAKAYRKFSELGEALTKNDLTPEDKTGTLLALRYFVSVTWGTPFNQLSARRILTAACLEEIGCLYKYKLDPYQFPPFTFCLALNYNRQLVKKVLDQMLIEQGTDLLRSLFGENS